MFKSENNQSTSLEHTSHHNIYSINTETNDKNIPKYENLQKTSLNFNRQNEKINEREIIALLRESLSKNQSTNLPNEESKGTPELSEQGFKSIYTPFNFRKNQLIKK
ncbi:hypothetical protein H311_01556 [Anncaliia algerae PRA109]|nr:hypothetical protein H311_01556 [Anncaliia algerae PRA109]